MIILKNKSPNTSITFEMRRRPLNAFPDAPAMGGGGTNSHNTQIDGPGSDFTLSRQVTLLSTEQLIVTVATV